MNIRAASPEMMANNVLNWNKISANSEDILGEIAAWHSHGIKNSGSPSQQLAQFYLPQLKYMYERAAGIAESQFESTRDPHAARRYHEDIITICGLTALSRLTRFSPLIDAEEVDLYDNIAGGQYSSEIPSDFIDSHFVEDSNDRACGIITSEYRFLTAYIDYDEAAGVADLRTGDTWYYLREAALFLRIQKPATASDAITSELTETTGQKSKSLELLDLPNSVRVMPYLSYKHSVLNFYLGATGNVNN